MAPTISVADLLAYGEQQIGKPYVFGAAGPNTFDCSGLITYMFKHFGVNLPHHAQDQARFGSAVNPSAISAGDLVFSDWGDGPNSHVGIATDSSHILVAPHTGTDVQVESLSSSYRSHITAVRRMPGLTSAPTKGPAPVSGGTPGGVPGTGGTAGTGVGSGMFPGPGNTAGGGLGAGSQGQTTGGSDNALESVWQGMLNAGSEIGHFFTGAYKEIAAPLQDIGSAAVEMATIGDKIFSLFLPSNFMRLVSGISGVALILIGIHFLRRELA